MLICRIGAKRCGHFTTASEAVSIGQDFSKAHKDLYWRTLKDERIIPFVAFAISYGSNEMVYDAFVLFTHCAQVQEFPIHLLANLTSVANKRSTNLEVSHESLPRNGHRLSLESSLDMATLYEIPSQNGSSFSNIEELLEQMKKGTNMNDLHKNREMELEKLITLKEQALSQSEHMRITKRDRNSSEVENLRLLLHDLENKNTGRDEEKDGRRHEFLKIDFESKYRELEQEKKQLTDENDKERDLHAVLRKRFDDITQKFDLATTTIFEKQMEIEKVTKDALEATQLSERTHAALEQTKKNCWKLIIL
uniref:Uncharacterized protein n=1 Tax=Ditylenchus dipsaci TaxID=166011 RepID=A0A915DRE9_9BILA